MNIVKTFLLIVIAPLVLTACGGEEKTLRVGSKNFAESMIHAEMIAQLAEAEGIAVERNIPFGNTQEIMEATKQNVIDVYPEYNGTGLIFLGQAAISDGDESSKKVQELFGPLGLEWKGRFGFSNDYAIVMTAERAQELNVRSLSDLAAVGSAINFAVDEDFSTRAADGLGPMTRRYGISSGNVQTFPGGSDGKDQIVLALLDGSADVAELFATDGQIAEYNLVVLEDDEAFFPVYQPAPLVRSDALAGLPKLGAVLDKLAGAMTAKDMQAMNKSVDLEAQTPASVATAFLVSKGLLPEGSGGGTVEKLMVAAGPGVGLDSDTAKALRAVRVGFPGKDLEILNSPDPAQALANGEARVAMIGAEAFYTLGDSGPEAKGTAQAFAVLGYKSGHLLARKSGSTNSIEFMKKIATEPEGSGSAVVLQMLLSSLGLSDSVNVIHSDAGLSEKLQGLESGAYDGVFTMTGIGDRAVGSALDGGAAKLLGIPEWADGGHTARFSFIRPATIAARTYSGHFLPIPTISTQYVLASPVEVAQSSGEVGPGTVGVASVVPVSADIVAKVRESLGDSTVVDPSIPVHSSLVPTIEVSDKSLPFSLDVSILNILIIVFTVWVIYLCGLPSPRDFTMPDEN